MKQDLNNETTYSRKRAKVLSEESDRVAKLFQVHNFYDNNNLNVQRLKQRITEAKRKLLSQKTSEIKQEIKMNTLDKPSRVTINYQKTKRCNSRATEHRGRKNQRVKRLVTDLGEYDMGRKNTETRSRIAFGQETPSGKDSRSICSLAFEPKKKLLSMRHEVNEFELKISVLWELYQLLIEIMQQVDRTKILNQELIGLYIKEVTSEKYEFIHELSDIILENRSQRTLRMSRLLENFSLFETCLNSINRPKGGGSAEIINFLGYSSSSIIFMVKLLFTTHETPLTLSEKTMKILGSITEFEQESYKGQLRSPKQILRRMEHNNEIISMLKTRCGKKHGKYCEQFITQMIRTVEQNNVLPFSEIANNIFEFLAFYLHHEGVAAKLYMLSMPPAPFIALKYPKTIVIEPWGVLIYRKNDKLVMRAHANKFLAEISDGCNLIFWTELMPKDADVLTSFFPVKDNISWLYRYHCTAMSEPIPQKTKGSPYKKKSHLKTEYSSQSIVSNLRLIKDISKIGSIPENTMIIDYEAMNILEEQRESSILAPWKGEKKDTRLLELSQRIKRIQAVSKEKMSPWVEELKKVKGEMAALLDSRFKTNKRAKYSLLKTGSNL